MMKYFPQGLKDTNAVFSSGNYKTQGTITNRPCRNKPYTQKQTNYPRNILEFNYVKGFHPTQKPVALLMYLIKTYTNEKETVLDFTMGSGSTGVACKNTNRNFIGIEKDDKYFEIAKQRIENGFVQKEIKLDESSPLFM